MEGEERNECLNEKKRRGEKRRKRREKNKKMRVQDKTDKEKRKSVTQNETDCEGEGVREQW